MLLAFALAASCTLDRDPVQMQGRASTGNPNQGFGAAGVNAGAGGALTAGVGGAAGNAGAAGAAGAAGSVSPPVSLPDGGVNMVPGMDASVPIDTSVECAPTGVYAIRARVDAYWGGRDGGLVALTNDGRGDITIDLLAEIGSVGDQKDFAGGTRVCGVDLPVFFSQTLCEAYKPVFSDRIFESPELPKYVLSGRFQCFHPGCLLEFDATAGLLGIDLNDPFGLWPPPGAAKGLGCVLGSGESCFPDHDADGLPGVTVELVDQGDTGVSCDGTRNYGFRAPPLNANPFAIFDGVVRANRLQLGVRTALEGKGVLAADCNSATGIGASQFMQSRAWGCRRAPGSANPGFPLAGANESCSADETLFMDENLPLYFLLEHGESPDPALAIPDKSPSPGTRVSMVRIGSVGDSMSCAQVRAVNH